MKIDKISHLSPAKGAGESKSSDRPPAAADAAAPGSSDVSRLRQPGADGSRDIDTARVAEIRQAIAEGRLEIRADRIADGLIDSVRELLEQEQQ